MREISYLNICASDKLGWVESLITINVGDIYSVYGLFEVWKVMIMWLPGIYKNVSPSGVQFENSEWRLCVWAGGQCCLCPWQFPLLNCTTVWETASFNTGYVPVFGWKIKEKSFWAGRISWLNMPRKERRELLCHICKTCVHTI